MITRSAQDRFWEKVIKSDGCWEWTSATWGSGYGFFWVGGVKRNEYAHRLSWEWANWQPVPEGMVVMHSCDNKKCVNPAHLSIGTNQDNKADSVRKRRHAFGERNGGGGKLTRSDADAIRASKGVLRRKELATRYGVHEGTIKSIWSGRTWRDC
jgi:hypothetical protein